MLEFEAYPVFKQKFEASRAARAEKTSEAQADVNDRNARIKLDRKIQHNFPEYESYVVGLDYEFQPTPEQAMKDRAAFIDECRRKYQRAGIEFKWLAVTPWLTETGRPVKRLHHHIIISGGVDEKVIREIWMKRRNGRIHIDPLQPDRNGVTGLSRYLHKHLHGTLRWTGSRNLEMPPPIYPAKHLDKNKAFKLAKDYEGARTYFENRYRNYTFCDMEVRFSEAVEGAYLFVRMRLNDAWQRKRPKPQKKTRGRRQDE
jgi:hypothetical protein